MTREILFRAKRKDGKGWVYGDLNQHDIHHGTAILENGVINNAVDKDTVGQYTGLKDKNGVKIFEGDIIESPSFIDTFSWVDGSYTFDKDISDSVMTAHYPYEVIGNIHDNPDLLNQNV